MNHSLSINIVNGPSGDPAVLVSLLQLGESLLFDAGLLEALSPRELLKIKVVCVSHTHLDHFQGFDRLLRVNVPHFRTVEVIGPSGILKNVLGKINSYTWNLLEPNQVNFSVHEVSKSGMVTSWKVTNTNNFEPILIAPPLSKESPSHHGARMSFSQGRYLIDTIILDHGTPVCAFALRLPETTNIDKAGLEALGLNPGPWIGELQRFVAENQTNREISTGTGQIFDAQDLAEKILSRRPGPSIAYITDIVFSQDNLDRLSPALLNATFLVCETNFQDLHRDRAFAKKHLTTRQAALIGSVIGTRELKTFHISNIYSGATAEIELEANVAFQNFSLMTRQQVTEEVAKECQAHLTFSN